MLKFCDMEENHLVITKVIKGKVIEINLQNLIENIHIIKNRLERGARFFPVVKSNAYGHGIENVVPILNEFSDGYCVGRVEEAHSVRLLSEKPIIILKGLENYQIDEISNMGEIFVVVRDLEDFEIKLRSKLQNLIIKIDTGMGRLGILYNDLQKILDLLEKYNGKDKIKGVMTHFAYSDFSDMEFIKSQNKIFDRISENLERFLGRRILKSISNSAGTLSDSVFHKDIVRPGICIYGISPFGRNNEFSLKPVMSVKTRVLAVKTIPKGWSVGYSRRFISADQIKIGVLDIGYSDGLPRKLWEEGFVFIRNKRFNIIGVISMDMMCFICDDDVRPGDEAYIMGDVEGITAYDLAERTETIPYEILCSMGIR